MILFVKGALADLLLVDGDPIANLRLIEDFERNVLVMMKHGKIYKTWPAPSAAEETVP